EVDKMASIRQEERKSGRGLACSWFRQHRRFASRRTHSVEPIERGRRKDNRTFPVPRPTAPLRCVAQDLRQPCSDVHLLEFALGKETNPLTIGRPEREAAIICTKQRLCSEGIERTNPQQGFASRIPGAEHKSSAIRRNTADSRCCGRTY